MKEPVKNTDLEKRIFDASHANFKDLALELFRFQYRHNEIYRLFCNSLKVDIGKVDSLQIIPFLPISFFKTHRVVTTDFNEEAVFESSGTTQTISSKHYIKELSLYRQSFNSGFKKFYGEPANKCILGLLPSYLERQNSSLVMMVDALIKESAHPLSGFYLSDHEKLHRTLLHNEILNSPPC